MNGGFTASASAANAGTARNTSQAASSNLRRAGRGRRSESAVSIMPESYTARKYGNMGK